MVAGLQKWGESDSETVLLQFTEEVLPAKVMVGYMSFNVRAYVPPAIRCYKCQQYSHTANVYRGKERCGRCGGEHAYRECGNEDKVKCCNCVGNHSLCSVRKQAVESQHVKLERRVTVKGERKESVREYMKQVQD